MKTISEHYLKLNKELHESNPHYGVSGVKRAESVIKLANSINTKSVLDYGCGKGTLAAAMPFPIWEYDPAIPGKDAEPRPADLVVCSDVLEHIEPELLENVFADLARLTKKVGYFVVHTGPAQKILSDGRNAHLIQEGADWWRTALSKYFKVAAVQEAGGGMELHIIVGPKEEVKGNDLIRHIDGCLFHTPNKITKWRCDTFFTKEPTTIEWLNSFKAGEIFFDIGANVGMYSIYATMKKMVQTFAFEPEAQNYMLLNQNIQLNKADAAITAYPIALSDSFHVGSLHLAQLDAGGSCHTFGEKKDFKGEDMEPKFSQGCVGLSLDYMVDQKYLPQPDHIKIDVDGIEWKIVRGAAKTIHGAKSVQIEVNPSLEEHQQLLKMMSDLGFTFDPEQVARAERKDGPFKGVAEYVFRKR